MAYLDINGYSLYYNKCGSGEPLILLSDGFYSSATWDTVREGLASSFTVIEYDRFGYGKSAQMEKHLEGDAIGFYADELHCFVKALGLDTFHLCGHCFGAAIALQYAYSHPGKAGKIIAEAPGVFSTPDILEKWEYVKVPFAELPSDLKNNLENMHGADYAPLLWEWILNYKATYIMCPDYDMRKEVKKLKNPLFFMFGDSDFYFDTCYAAAVFELKKRNRRLWIAPGTGHLLHQERSAEFVEHALTFLK